MKTAVPRPRSRRVLAEPAGRYVRDLVVEHHVIAAQKITRIDRARSQRHLGSVAQDAYTVIYHAAISASWIAGCERNLSSRGTRVSRRAGLFIRRPSFRRSARAGRPARWRPGLRRARNTARRRSEPCTVQVMAAMVGRARSNLPQRAAVHRRACRTRRGKASTPRPARKSSKLRHARSGA